MKVGHAYFWLGTEMGLKKKKKKTFMSRLSSEFKYFSRRKNSCTLNNTAYQYYF